MPESSTDTAELPEVSTLSYEQARDELVGIVARLESGQLGLEASMTLWERGEALAAHCTSWLDGAQARLDGTEADANTSPEGENPAH
ncbi:exodeoxyribonuclease VII small subunit [Piscicoccus intestinalis]|uniref:exodeoxyribonuclease VII small subunit n=1 Tax=Piscicoccus intestinalis TaxID=746033 RepID=UPI0008389079|nr:exodeoxyribonuclease VII small subunit [Piscicoccus intestinalis]